MPEVRTFDPHSPIKNYSPQHLLGERTPEVCRMYPGLEGKYNRRTSWSGFFEDVRTFGKTRRPFLRDYFSGFPNGIELGEYMDRVLSVLWFTPQRVYTPEDLQLYAKEIDKRFGIEVRGAEVETNPGRALDFYRKNNILNAARDVAFGDAWSSAKGAVGDVARDAVLGATGDAARRSAKGATGDAAWDASEGAAQCAALIVVQDLPEIIKKYPHGNPFEPLLGLYELGLGLPQIDKKGTLGVWHPEVRQVA